MWLTALPSLLFGVLAVLVPLRLGDAGWGAAAIGAVFVIAAGFEVAISPLLGRLSDRVGRHLPLRLAATASIAVSLALAWAGSPWLVAVLVVAAALSYGAFWAPAIALLSDRADRLGLAQALAFGLVNVAWAGGNVVGPAAGGGLADLAGDSLPFVLAATLCALTALALGLPNILGTRLQRVPEQLDRR